MCLILKAPGCTFLVMSSEEMIRNAVRQARRYHQASLQDQNPIVASRHNAYAVALIDAVRDVSDDDEVLALTGESLSGLRRDILEFQDKIEAVAFRILKDLKSKGIAIPGF